MPLILGAQSATGAAEVVTNSCRFDGSSDYLHKTLSSPGNRRKWTFSCWAKRCVQTGSDHIFGAPQNSSNYDQIYFAGTVFRFDHWISGSSAGSLVTDRVFRDPTAWYHIVCVWDSDNADASLRMRLYVNGTEETSFSTDTNPSLNADSYVNSTSYPFEVGAMNTGEYYDGYMAEVVFIDGLALTPSSFGEFDTDSPTIWKPIDVSGLTFGTNGFYLDFKDSANLGNDASGGTDLTEVNLAAIDQCTDTPVNNFCTWNPLDNYYQGATFAEGNCKFTTTTTAESWNTGTFGVNSGKWYWEIKGDNFGIAGLVTDGNTGSYYLGNKVDTWGYYVPGTLWHNGSSTLSWGSSFTPAVLMGVALDLDNNFLYLARENVWQNSGVPTSGATGTGGLAVGTPSSGFYYPANGDYGGSAEICIGNFGNPIAANTSDEADENGYGKFEYAPPTGYLALCTKNLGSDGG